MSAAEVNYMLKIVTGLLSRRESAIFREPVDHKGLGLTDYPDIVKEPRDLGTIKKKLEAGGYKDIETMVKDIRLVWSNCMLYNRDGSEVSAFLYFIRLKCLNCCCFFYLTSLTLKSPSFLQYYHLADKFARAFEDSYQAFVRLTSEEDPNKLPTVEERLRLSYDLFKIDNTEMAHALTIIEEECENAIARKPDDVLINFDALTAKCFHRLNKFVCKALLDTNQKKPKAVKKRPAEASSSASTKRRTK